MPNSYETSSKSKSVFNGVSTQKRGTCVTVIVLGIIIGIFAFAYISFGNEPINQSEKHAFTLKLVNIILNHGQMSPKFTYPKDLYRNNSRWRDGLGELSKKGKQSVYNTGKYFRELYSTFLPDLYFASDLKVLSSEADTCLMTAAVFLAALYPPHKFQIWNPHILWQPVPIRSISNTEDNMLDVSKHCRRLTEQIEDLEKQIIQEDERLVTLYDYLTKHTGLEVKNLSTILSLYNLFDAQNRNNFVLPPWAELIYPTSLLKYSIKALSLETENYEVIKLSTGVLLEKITSNLIRKRDGDISEKLFLYSAHEKSIFNLLHLFDKEMNETKPQFSSSVIIELHHINNETVVQAYHHNDLGKEPIPVNITECGNPCYLDDFINFSKALIPNNWDDACSS